MELKSQILEVLEHYPDLSFNEINNSIDGELFISNEDFYDVLIELDQFPENFPKVFETGERIPRKVTRHIYSDSGSCCLSTQAKAQVLLKTQINTLYLFVKEIVVPYFQNNSYYEINGHYKTEEYSHNKLGIIEAYRDILQISDDYRIGKLMFHRIEGKKLRMHDLCYCGSGQIIKKCNNRKHYHCYKDLRKIDIDILKIDLVLFIEILQTQKIIKQPSNFILK